MATSLISPGVQVSVIDESNYAPTGAGTIPFILIATAQDKTNPSGTVAEGTTKANVGTIYNVTSQRDLTNYFGIPNFPTDASGNRIFGDERCEYGLHAAYNVLDIISSAYVVRADIDLDQIAPANTRPTAAAAGGTVWLDTATTSWGIFEWNKTTQAFVRIIPTNIIDTTKLSNSVPISSYGSIGEYAIVGTNSNNPLYTKNYLNNWVLVGSTTWQQTCAPAVVGTNSNVANIVTGNSFKINNTTITVGGSGTISSTSLATQINALNSGAGITGVTAAVVLGQFVLFVTNSSKSDGNTIDGAVKIENVSGTVLSLLGITSGTYLGPITQCSKHSSVPTWKSVTPVTARPTGSIWIKTTNFNYGANYTTYRRNAITNKWDLIPNLLYAGFADAIYNLDPTKGGAGIPLNTLFTKYAANGDQISSLNSVVIGATIQSKTYIRSMTGATSITATNSNPTLTAGNTFTVFATQVNSQTNSRAITITVPASPNNTVQGVAAAISAANLVQGDNVLFSASVNATGNITFTHPFGGTLYATNGTGTPLDDMGFDVSIDGVEIGAGSVTYTFSNWSLLHDLISQPNEPTSIPTDGTLWYYPKTEADIMINSGHSWRGYRMVTADVRGYNLTLTDTNGPIFSYEQPTTQSNGNALVYGDLWIDTSKIDNYPVIYRWQSQSGTDQWVQVDTTDSSDENGILFADARWDTDGSTDIFLDTITPITALLLSDYTDLDVPDPALYPIGTLLFNTRRSGYNVKQYVKNYFTADNFPLLSLPATVSTWQSASGKKWNNVPYFGRQAQRNVVVSAMEEAITTNEALREEGKVFNLLTAPGYVELLQVLTALNDDRKNTGFIISEAPMGLSTDTNSIENWATDNNGTGLNGESGLISGDAYTAVFYPGTAIMNPVAGTGNIAVPMSTLMLRTFVRNDQIGELWFAPAGNTRGVVDNALAIGYIDRNKSNIFVPTGVPQSLRDTLYENHINPVTFFPGVGIINYGNHTRQADATALDRINVARLVCYLRQNIERLMRPLVFEPNDKTTRDTAKALIDKLMIDVTSRRGLYDHLVVCDSSNNTPDTINRNELHVDVAIEPVKAVEFIYIPVRLKATGQIASGNISPALPVN